MSAYEWDNWHWSSNYTIKEQSKTLAEGKADFDYFDINDDGKVSASEYWEDNDFEAKLGSDTVFAHFDADRDGQWTLEEYLDMNRFYYGSYDDDVQQ
eukprot:NODE_4681_length_636_cov_143.804089_g4021_i0.p1 GENE.NODE_4681_length_636_cov_143.804089_g4021_i0~~NODE_4681_length_636_cov_143.804089_g4021_i0.p1  ORF type:complete len:97 (+),score=21.12 NODE_4681_length_636_cov_143.804089_g4021_i0:313-603(+)